MFGYGLTFIAATLVAFSVFAFCLYFAVRQGTRSVATLCAGSLFGLLIEYLNIKLYDDYYYGPFPLMVFGTVPIMIVLSWGAIVFGSMQTSDRLDLLWFLRPVYDGLLALTIDLSLDPLSINLGFWTWKDVQVPFGGTGGSHPLEKPWFGVPFGNYYGWYMVVAWFSFLIRLGFRLFPAKKFGAKMNWLIPLLAIPLTLIPFYASFLVYSILLIYVLPEPALFSLLLGVNLLAVLVFLPSVSHDAPLDPVSLGPPVFFHGFIMISLYATGLYLQLPALVLLCPAVATLCLILYLWPYLNDLTRRMTPRFNVRSRVPMPQAVETPVAAEV